MDADESREQPVAEHIPLVVPDLRKIREFKRLGKPKSIIRYINDWLSDYHDQNPTPNLDEMEQLCAILKVQLQAMWVEHRMKLGDIEAAATWRGFRLPYKQTKTG